MRERALAVLPGVLLLVALLAAYANHFHNSFHFDDAHTVENNASIHALRNIPLFFRDATTFSSLPTNQSYRPLVSTLLAIDYKLGGGLHPFWFHLSIFALFVGLTLLLALVIRRLLDATATSARNGWCALAAAAWYGLHPANADTINYIVALSDVISTLGVVASFALYFAFPNLRRYYLYLFPAAIAILAKPPAAIFVVLFAIYRLLFWRNDDARLGETRPTPGVLRRVAELVPPFVICAALLLLVRYMTPRTWISGADNARHYLITQPYVAWLYFKTFFWPVGLSADYDLNPFTTTDDARFWIGFAFVALFIAIAITASVFKKTRVLGFGLLWFLITLLPTSLLPLAEVMNGHRTFLPYIGLVIAMAGAIALVLNRGETRRLLMRIAVACVAGLFLCVNGYATFQRNKVWKSEETLWRDVTIKSPQNGRGLMNYGNTLMARGNYTGALVYFHRAKILVPFYPVLFVNLGIAEAATGQTIPAEHNFKEALRLAPANPDCYTYYARYLLAHSRATEALVLLRAARTISPANTMARDLLAQAGSAVSLTKTSTESLLTLSLHRYREKRFRETIAACEIALALKPDYAEAWNNIGAAYNELGEYTKAASACEQAIRLRPDFALARNNLQLAQTKLEAAAK